MRCEAQKALEQFHQSMSWGGFDDRTRRAAQILLKGERSIFEVIDATNDEVYMPLGVYENLEDACEMATEGSIPPAEDAEEHCIIEVRYRPLNRWSVSHPTIATFEWEEHYDMEFDKNFWRWSEIWRSTVLSDTHATGSTSRPGATEIIVTVHKEE